MPCFTNAPKMNIRCGKESGKVIYTRNRRQRESGYSIISYIAMTEGGEAIEGENVLPDVNIDIEGDLIMRSEIERLIQLLRN